MDPLGRPLAVAPPLFCHLTDPIIRELASAVFDRCVTFFRARKIRGVCRGRRGAVADCWTGSQAQEVMECPNRSHIPLARPRLRGRTAAGRQAAHSARRWVACCRPGCTEQSTEQSSGLQGHRPQTSWNRRCRLALSTAWASASSSSTFWALCGQAAQAGRAASMRQAKRSQVRRAFNRADGCCS